MESNKCFAMLSVRYKFYLSFENSLCRDYVTEKFFDILRLDVVPVVYGGANYSKLAPPHSYIDALSFPSAKALALHLLYLHHNHTAYNEYFRWKRFHIVRQDFYTFCKLCEKLHTDTTPKTYDIQKWFVEESHCRTKDTPEISTFLFGNRHHHQHHHHNNTTNTSIIPGHT
ncbi:hypothetical protein Pmani_005403 [Petrolisthes manimaculis]|uniref:Fucosyltransferase n=1 Tax=Petrolisthes manimaculis TaxID=1843537 RepID=A0AAE1UMZ6_9EUCA|nr:hypothetical protein Pmani_005403 [Petrolisthes manimaculis]